jgi:hypothetical protein
MKPIIVYNTDARFAPKRPAAMPKLSADSRPGHPRNAVAHMPAVRFTDWALI